MSTSDTVSDLTPEELAFLETIVDDTPTPLSPQGARMVELGLSDKKARRLDRCGGAFQFVRHGDHPAQRQNISRCGYRSCQGCAACKAFQQYMRYKPMRGMIGAHFTHLEIYRPFSLDDSEEYIRYVNATIKHFLPEGTIGKTVRREDEFVTKVLHAAPISSETRKCIMHALAMGWLECRMVPAIRNVEDFDKVLSHVLLPELPQDAGERAEFEVALQGVHQCVALVPSKHVNKESALTVLVHLPDPGDANKLVKRRVPRCKHCGGGCTHHTQSFPAHASLQELSKARWVPYFDPPSSP